MLEITILPNISKWLTDNAIDFSLMLLECSELLSLPDISIWNINKLQNLNGIFAGCSS